MGRRKGSRDLKPRKKRKDKGKRRKERIVFPKRYGRKTELKLQIWEKRPMSRDGIKHWNKRIRPKIKKTVYLILMRVDAPVEYLEDEEALKQFALEVIGYEGYFLIMGCSGSPRTRTGVKWVRLCDMVIRNSPSGLVAFVANKYRLSRYWFWRGD